jgi:4,5-dihydroxyphthalate decarboxylase
MKNVKLTIACGRYDRTQPLIDGRVEPEGVDLTFIPLRPGETFWRMLNHGEFDASEMSLSSYTILRSEGDTRFIAIPVFPSRVFRHSAIYLRADSKIETPQDLKGRRVGVGDYQMTAAVWVRGLLAHDYDVMPGDIEWVTGRPVRAVRKPEGVRIVSMPSDTTLEQMLERGEIDALASVMIPKGLGKNVRRLFRNFRAVEAAYFRKDRHFPHHAHVRAESFSLRDESLACDKLLSGVRSRARHRLWHDL